MNTYSDPTYQRTTVASRRAMRRVRYIHRNNGQPYVTGANARKRAAKVRRAELLR